MFFYVLFIFMYIVGIITVGLYAYLPIINNGVGG